mmetsp:Transcript_27155/g.65326  ORF Transcript_27155/g.65326 Transcript_27155/m.65326 type:complete len:303 (+) Transcript_27155:740-1648(+)
MELGINKIPTCAMTHEIITRHWGDVRVQLKIQNTASSDKSGVALLFSFSHSIVPFLPHLLRGQHLHLIHNLMGRHRTGKACRRCIRSENLMPPLLRGGLRLRRSLGIAVRSALGVSLSSEGAFSLHLDPPYRNLLKDFPSGIGNSDVIFQRIRFLLLPSINSLLDLLLLASLHVVEFVHHHFAEISRVLDCDQVGRGERLFSDQVLPVLGFPVQFVDDILCVDVTGLAIHNQMAVVGELLPCRRTAELPIRILCELQREQIFHSQWVARQWVDFVLLDVRHYHGHLKNGSLRAADWVCEWLQ